MAIELIQGDSLDLEFRTTDRRDLTDFTCQLQVRDSGDAIANGIDRAINTYNSNNTSFEARLTPAESGGLTEGTYKISAQLSNSTTNESLELSDDLVITKQYNY